MSDELPPAAGRFVWADLMTTDLPRAREFYFALFPGWAPPEEDPPKPPSATYQKLTLEGRDVGGLVALDPGHDLLSHWVPYATVANVDSACEKTSELGGKVCVPPFDIPGRGRVAVIEDPQGAYVSPIALSSDLPERSGPMPDGTFCWHQLLSPRPAEIVGFYTTLFEWSHAEVPTPIGHYHLLRRGSVDAAGILPMPEDADGPPQWVVYIYAKDLEAQLAKVVQLGGAVHRAITLLPGIGQFAAVSDPMGASFCLFRSERS